MLQGILCITPYYIILYYAIQSYLILYYTILYCTILYHNAQCSQYRWPGHLLPNTPKSSQTSKTSKTFKKQQTTQTYQIPTKIPKPKKPNIGDKWRRWPALLKHEQCMGTPTSSTLTMGDKCRGAGHPVSKKNTVHYGMDQYNA